MAVAVGVGTVGLCCSVAAARGAARRGAGGAGGAAAAAALGGRVQLVVVGLLGGAGRGALQLLVQLVHVVARVGAQQRARRRRQPAHAVQHGHRLRLAAAEVPVSSASE